ncbi:hypothetical protein [Caminibacter sp.]
MNIINKIEEYLRSLDKKNKIMLYFGVFLLGGLFYYYVNYEILELKINKLENAKQSLLEKIKRQKTVLAVELIKLRKNYNALKKENFTLKENLKYLEMLVNTSNILIINDKTFFSILNKVLENSKKNDINSSYLIKDMKKEGLKQFDVITQGNIDTAKFFNIVYFLRDVEKIYCIKTLKKVDFNKSSNKIKFNIEFNFWSYK